MNVRTNFALGSTSSQVQEVLVTDLPRSYHNARGKPERGGGKRWRTGFSTFTAALK